jgi:Flp pilus assembly protein TadD
MRLAAEGKREEAKKALEQLVALRPDSALAHNDLGILHYQGGDKHEALRHYERAAQLDRSNVTFLKNLADCYWVEFGRLEDAMRIYVEVLSTQPKDVEALTATGRVCVELRQYDDARVFFEKALEIEPWNQDIRYQFERLESASQAA